MQDGESIVAVRSDEVALEGLLERPDGAAGVVLFAHGSGSSRHSPRNRYVAEMLRRRGLATLRFDLLTLAEDADPETRFDVALLARRVRDAVRFVSREPGLRNLAIGLFGASTGAAAALCVAAQVPDSIGAVVTRGGRPDLAGSRVLRAVRAPTLVVVGGHDYGVLELNRDACAELACEKSLEIIPGATHLFEEPGALEQVARLAADWFGRHLHAA